MELAAAWLRSRPSIGAISSATDGRFTDSWAFPYFHSCSCVPLNARARREVENGDLGGFFLFLSLGAGVCLIFSRFLFCFHCLT